MFYKKKFKLIATNLCIILLFSSCSLFKKNAKNDVPLFVGSITYNIEIVKLKDGENIAKGKRDLFGNEMVLTIHTNSLFPEPGTYFPVPDNHASIDRCFTNQPFLIVAILLIYQMIVLIHISS